MKDYEMFTDAGNEACDTLVNKIIEKYKDSKLRDLKTLRPHILVDIGDGMKKIADTHPEVYDSEPPWHICAYLNKWFRENCDYELELQRFDIPY